MKITVDRALLEQAVEAQDIARILLEHTDPYPGQEDMLIEGRTLSKEVIAALRAALAVPQVEPWTRLILGKFAIGIGMHQGKLSITHESGEGGEFDAAKFEACVAEFFRENF